MTAQADAAETLRELSAWLDATEVLPRELHFFAGKNGECYPVPPPGLSARQRLEWANNHCVTPNKSQPVTVEEIGLSPIELARLSPERKLALANEKMARRMANR